MENQDKLSSFTLYATMFIMGGCGLAYEYTISKTASDLLGNSVQQWAIIIASMMLFMGIGSDVQKYLKGNNLIEIFLIAEILLALSGAIAPIAMLYTYGTNPEYYILVQYAFIAVIGLLIGFEIPLLTRINTQFTKQLSFNLGNILKMDYIGSLAGAIAWVFILPKFFTIPQSAFVLAAINLAAAGLALLYFKKWLPSTKKVSLFFFFALGVLITGFLNVRDWTSYSEQFLYRDKIILSKTTKFQHIVLTKSKANDYSLFINSHLQFNSVDEFIYHENLVHPAFLFSQEHRDVLILGGGDGLALREILKYPGVKNVVLCDLDPEIVNISKSTPALMELADSSLADARITHLINNSVEILGKDSIYLKRGKNKQDKAEFPVAEINLIHIDAFNFLDEISGLYDIIIIDFPDPNSPELSKLYSNIFYERLKNKLKKTGIFMQQSSSPFFAKEAYLAIGRTINASNMKALPYHDNVPTFGEWGWWLGGHPEYMNALNFTSILSQTDSIPVPTQYLTPELIQSGFQFGKNELKTDEVNINTLTEPIVYNYYLQGWSRFQN